MARLRSLLAALVALLLLALPALAYDEAIIGQSERLAQALGADLKQIEAEIQASAYSDDQLSKYRGRIEDIRAKAAGQLTALAGPIDEVNQQIGLLGPPPGEGQTEAETVAAQRKLLGDALNQLQGVRSQLEIVGVEAEQLGGRISSIQRSEFVKRIFQGSRSILNPLLWRDTAIGFGLFLSALTTLLSTWWAQVRGTANLAALALIPVFLAAFLAIFYALRNRLMRWIETNIIANQTPDEMDRLWRIVRATAAAFVFLLLLFLPVEAALSIGGFLTPRFELVWSAGLGIVFTTLIYGVIARRVAAPGQPVWRIIDLDEPAARRFPLLVTLTALVSITAEQLSVIADNLYLPVTYTIGQSAISAVLMLLLLALILIALRSGQGLPGRTSGRRVYFTWAASFVPAVWGLIAAATVALLLGYIALAAFVAKQIFETGMLVGVLFLLHHLSDAAVVASFDPQSVFGRFLRRATGFGERGIERIGLLFRTIVDLLLLLAGVPLLLVLWTVTWIDFRSLANTAFFGFKVGDVNISLWSVVLVAAALIVGVILTNLAIRWLDRRILAQTRIDKGVQDSIRKGASYAGYILAAGFAFTAAGFDFSNLAIIAGALGVGIGFGLQSIVNNFVSGLILLAERPIRVGDWVTLPSGEGIVKRINVRSTEIETFDSCSVIVPNSLLITEPVKNWTHGDSIGRFTVAVPAPYDCDAAAVARLLLDLTGNHPLVLTYPEPQVTLSAFAANGLRYEIKAYVADIYEGVKVASDLRLAILTAFREKGITIPQAPVVSMGG